VAYCLAQKLTSSNSIQINSYLFSLRYLLPRGVDKIRKVKRHIQREQAIGVHYFLIPTNFNRQIGTPINLSQTVRIQSQSAPYQGKRTKPYKSNNQSNVWSLITCGIVKVNILGVRNPPFWGGAKFWFPLSSSITTSSVEYDFLGTPTSTPRIEPC